MTLADRDTAPPGALPSPRIVPLLALLLLLVLAVGGGVLLLLRPKLDFTNRLAAPVRLGAGAGGSRSVAPGETVRLTIPRGHTLVAEWELVRPLSADGAPMGEAVKSAAVLQEPRGVIRVAATSQAGDGDYFAPLITNASSQALRVTVNAGLRGAVDCGCAVRPGTRRVFIGYYRLFRNSTVRVTGAGGVTAAFVDLGPRVTAVDGTVGLRFDDRDLRKP
ncbi:MAG: hypothetical protein ACJ8DC_18170 [Gemmatimonadales bacterium]